MSHPEEPTEGAASPHRTRNTLLIPLVSAVGATILVAILAVSLMGLSGWLRHLGEILVMALLAVLAFRGKGWARWVLILWLGFLALSLLLFSSRLAAANPFATVLFVAIALLYVWVIVELIKVDISGPPVTRI